MRGGAHEKRSVLIYGFKLSENFGGPSVVHGFREALRRIAPGLSLRCYQPTPVDPISVSDMDFPVREYPYGKSVKPFLRDWARQKFLRCLPADSARRDFWLDYRAADVVVNVYAICFCGNWGTKAFSSTRNKSCLKYMLQQFLPNLVARIDGKLSVKSTASFGQLNSEALRKVARWSMRWCFARVVAREDESRRQLVEDAGVAKEVLVAPDLANLMPVVEVTRRTNRVGIVTSFQMERKWNGPGEGYLACMTALVRHLRDVLGCEVELIPNQMNGPEGRGDLEVAHEIRSVVGGDDVGVSIFDSSRFGGLELKRALAECEAVVSPRYHSCVAALSAGVPLLTLGWHYKYQELMALYGQDLRMLPGEACTAKSLVETFDALWNDRVQIRGELSRRAEEVSAAVVDSVRYMLA